MKKEYAGSDGLNPRPYIFVSHIKQTVLVCFDRRNLKIIAIKKLEALKCRTSTQIPHLEYYANARARKLATPSVVAVNAWCCQFSLQHGLAASVGIVMGKVTCC